MDNDDSSVLAMSSPEETVRVPASIVNTKLAPGPEWGRLWCVVGEGGGVVQDFGCVVLCSFLFFVDVSAFASYKRSSLSRDAFNGVGIRQGRFSD